MNAWRNSLHRRIGFRRLIGATVRSQPVQGSGTAPEPSRDLMRDVVIGFLRQRTTFTEWCRQNGIHCPSARMAVIGSWDGTKGKAMRRRIVRAARIGEAA